MERGASQRDGGSVQVFVVSFVGTLGCQIFILPLSRFGSERTTLIPKIHIFEKIMLFSLALVCAILTIHPHFGYTQQVTAISQAPGFSSLASCAQKVAVGVIDNSNSPECPGGSPPNCYCGAEVESKEYSDQISTNVLNNCITSPRPQATQAASVFAAYCSLGGTAKGSSSVTVPSKTGELDILSPRTCLFSLFFTYT